MIPHDNRLLGISQHRRILNSFSSVHAKQDRSKRYHKARKCCNFFILVFPLDVIPVGNLLIRTKKRKIRPEVQRLDLPLNLPVKFPHFCWHVLLPASKDFTYPERKLSFHNLYVNPHPRELTPRLLPST